MYVEFKLDSKKRRLTIEQFTDLLGYFDRNYEKAIDISRVERGYIRKKGRGQKSKLSTPKRRLFFILTYNQMLSNL